MTDILLQTKLFIPQTRPFLVERPQLNQKLDDGQNGRITLISAPAGYGKTTLVTNWLKQREQKAAWYALDEYDNDPPRFLRYFIAAWQTLDPTIGQEVQAVLQSETIGSSPQPLTTFFTLLINQLVSVTHPIIFVIDDFHLITDESLLKGLEFWFEHAPPHIHTILISRADPPLSLTKWQVRSQLTKLNAQDLQFSTTEAADFLRQVMQLDLTTEEIETLVKKTDGWIASLQLAALSLQGTASAERNVAEFGGNERQMMAYLLEEVWQKQPEDIQQFLLQTAVFHRFNAQLANTVTQFDNCHDLIAQLDKKNLFLRALDNQQNWVCYHPIFADFLQKRQKESDPQQFLQLNREASRWFAQHYFVEEAIHHALVAQEFEAAAQLILKEAQATTWQQNHSQTLRRWTKSLPEDVLFGLPELTVYSAWTYVLHGKFVELLHFLDRAEAYWEKKNIVIANSVLGEIAILRGEKALAYGRFQEAIQWFNQAETNISAENLRLHTALLQVQGFAYRVNGDIANAKSKLALARDLMQTQQESAVRVFASYDYAKTLMIAGELYAAEQVLREVISAQPGAKYASNATLSLIYCALGDILHQRNQQQDAQEHLEKSIALAKETSESNPAIHQGYLYLATVKQASGDWFTAQSLMEKAEEIAQNSHNDRTIAQTLMVKATLHLLQEDVTDVQEWLENRLALPHQPDAIPIYQYHEEQVVLARYLCQTAPHKASPFLQNLLDTAVSQGWQYLALQCHILLALLHQSQNNNEKALTALTAAVTIATPERYIYPFVREKSAMGQLLRLASTRKVEAEAIGQIQAAFMPTAVSTQPLIDPLTERELEVLTLMANGRTNPEIAAKLFLATGTVAKYSNTIYAKLAVRNRTEATQRAKSLGLIE